MPIESALIAKALIRDTECLALEQRHSNVVDDVVGLQCLYLGPDFSCRTGGIFGDRGNINVKRVEKQSAAWKVGARFQRAIVKQRMQRIEANGCCPHRGCNVDQVCEVGKVSMAPVS